MTGVKGRWKSLCNTPQHSVTPSITHCNPRPPQSLFSGQNLPFPWHSCKIAIRELILPYLTVASSHLGLNRCEFRSTLLSNISWALRGLSYYWPTHPRAATRMNWCQPVRTAGIKVHTDLSPSSCHKSKSSPAGDFCYVISAFPALSSQGALCALHFTQQLNP